MFATAVLFAQSCGKRERGFHGFGNTKGKHCWKNNTSVQQTRRCTAAHWKPFKYRMAIKHTVTDLQSAAREGGYFYYYDFLWYWRLLSSLKLGKRFREGWEMEAGSVPPAFAPSYKTPCVKEVFLKHRCHRCFIPGLWNIQASCCEGEETNPLSRESSGSVAAWALALEHGFEHIPRDLRARVLCWTGLL